MSPRTAAGRAQEFARTLTFLVGMSTPTSAVAAAASYIGASQCKLCHRDVYQSWAKTPHARAIDAVPPVAEIGEPERTRCLTCHATDETRLPSVQCEACHGPGSDYAAPEVMLDPDKAAAAGLVRPSLGLCERCHENDEPRHRGELTPPVEADWPRFVHELDGRE